MPDQENVVDLDMDLGLDLGTDIFPDLLDLPPPLNLFNGMWMTPIQSEGASESTPTSLTKPSQQSNPLIPDSVAEIYHQGYSPSTEAEAMEPRQYHPTDPSVDAQLSFPDMRQVHLDQVDQENFAHVPEIRQDTVDEVTKLARAMEYTPTFPPFTDLRVPPAPVINAWVQLYFEHFHPVFPVLHKASFGSAGTHWLLVFAVSAIGAQFSQLPQAHICSRAMNEVVRRQAIYLCEIQNRLGRELWMVQVILLNQIAMRYSGERRALEIAEFLQALPVTVARRKQLFTDVMSLTNMSSLDLSLQQKWQVWVLDEERRRTGFAIWLIDQACETHFDLTPIMRIEELQNSLPHEENRWETSNAQGWACSSHDPGSWLASVFTVGNLHT
ncbi:hypothetical protein N7532_005206 [Penicillium argentinense]|uniref:Xylanolytic transcriptional activator regulatory domain-containing protein n=1 Tax=Penicillium argentinense TaxID=1131581 RepID=A0A9W9K9R5_9EURO|nr:uncharacterized protein N7532_005206 [Penicillium argentinense]KAJ5098205.1 hypothetical protein N7532_005206 [Penicillium argentinense]